ncbi:MAG: TIGR02206 family membrane protein [Bacteroidota bacterium]
MNAAFLTENHDFAPFGQGHLFALFTAVVFGIVITVVTKRYLNEQQTYWLANAVAWFIMLTVIAWTFIKIYLGIFTYTTDLPLPLCNFMAFLLPLLTYTRSYRLYEVLYFWILAGTLQANITPDLANTFPHYTYFKYWIVHSGLVMMIIYIGIAYRMRPTWKSILRSYLWLQVFFVLMLLVNYLLGSNYNYLNAKPTTASILDLFPGWPYYVLVVQAIILPLMALVYLPFAISDSIRKWRQVP